LHWAGYAMRSQNSLLRAVLEQNPVEKRPLGRPKLMWEDTAKRDVKHCRADQIW